MIHGKKIVLRTFLVYFILLSPVFANLITEDYFQGIQEFEKANYKKSMKIFKHIMKAYPEAPDLGRVQFQIGLCYEKLKKYKKAFKAYEKIFSHYPDFENLEKIVEHEYKIANLYESGEMKSLLGLDFAESEKTALEIYDRVIKNFPFGVYAEDAFLKSIHILIRTKKYSEADEKITLFKKLYEKSTVLDEVHYLNGYIYYLQINKVHYDQSNTTKALEKFVEYLEKFPSGKFITQAIQYVNELKDLISKQSFLTAEFYLKQGKQEAAKKYFEEIINNFPNTEWAKLASRRISLQG